MSLNSNTESMQELLDEANALPTEDEVYERGFAAGRQTDTTLTKSGVPADAKATGDAIGQVRTDLGKIADHPVETGTDGVWTWEKWDSGKAVCKAVFSGTITSIDQKWGDYLYEKTILEATDYPIQFISVPLELPGLRCSAGVMLESHGAPSTTTTAKYYAVRPNRSIDGTGDYALSLYVEGRYK